MCFFTLTHRKPEGKIGSILIDSSDKLVHRITYKDILSLINNIKPLIALSNCPISGFVRGERKEKYNFSRKLP